MNTALIESFKSFDISQIYRDVRAEVCKRNLTEFVKDAWHVVEPGEPLIWNWHIEAVCDHLQAVTSGTIHKLVINIPPGHMKPLDSKTLVLMGDGSRKQLGEIQVGDIVVSHKGKRREVSAVHRQGHLPTLKITTETGREVYAALDHPFLTPKGWVQAQYLREGDTLGLVVPEPLMDDIHQRSNEEFRLAGYFIGDGSVKVYDKTSQSLITCFDPIEAADIKVCCDRMGFTFIQSKRPGVINISGGSRKWLENIGMAGQGSHTKRVPQFVFRGTNTQIGHFLGAYFACDGSMSRKGLARRDLSIVFNSVNRDLLADTQNLLLRLGVRARIRKHVSRNNSFTKGDHVSYRLELSSQDDTSKFIDRVPVYHDKDSRLKEWGVRRTNFDSIHIPDKIASIESSGERECCCLTVEEDHSFLAEDLAVHNSLLTSVFWPAWEWISMPHLRSQYGSYDEALAMRDSSKTRDLINSDWYQETFQPDWFIKRDSNAKGYFVNNRQGFRRTFATGGKVTGHRGEKVVLDDPLNARDMFNVGVKKQCQWLFDKVLSTRVNDIGTGRFVVIMQRLADDDLAGVLLQRSGWDSLILPSRFDPDRRRKTLIGWTDPREQKGDLLFPKKFPEVELARLENESLGPDIFAGQYQQDPVREGGARFREEHFRYWHWEGPVMVLDRGEGVLDRFRIDVCSVFATVDVAASEKRSADYTVYWICAVTPKGDLLILAEHRDRIDEVKSIALAKRIKQEWPQLSHFVVEQNGVGLPLIANMADQGLAVRPFVVSQDKMAMSVTAVVRCSLGKVFLPKQVPGFEWVKAARDELLVFPAGEHDDRVTAISLAAISLFENMPTVERATSVSVNRDGSPDWSKHYDRGREGRPGRSMTDRMG